MQQPSAQGIASLYRGNPQPLQQSIQKDQKAHPGLPPDLQKLLALQIVNNEKDGFAAQKAMQQLQQMGGQTGQPPTVMQSLEEQAKQKLQAQNMQAQQQQQGLQALAKQAPAGAVPEGTPSPEQQPQATGIDQLPVQFGMAGGGLVTFDDGGDIPDEPATLDAAKQAVLRQAMEQMRGKPDEAFATGAERSRKYVGIDDLLKEKEARIAATQQRMDAAKAGRTPEWVKGLQALSGPAVRGGLGMMLGQAGAAATHAREGYGAEDLANASKIDALKDAVLQARIEGRYKDAAAGEAAIRDLTANKRQAESSVTSMSNADEAAKARMQAAKDAAAARAQMAKERSAAGVDTQRLAELKALQKQYADQMKTTFNKADKAALQAKLAAVESAIAKMAGLDTMGAAPGAASPGGTMSGWGKAQVVK
jgi:hypothetical protein